MYTVGKGDGTFTCLTILFHSWPPITVSDDRSVFWTQRTSPDIDEVGSDLLSSQIPEGGSTHHSRTGCTVRMGYVERLIAHGKVV